MGAIFHSITHFLPTRRPSFLSSGPLDSVGLFNRGEQLLARPASVRPESLIGPGDVLPSSYPLPGAGGCVVTFLGHATDQPCRMSQAVSGSAGVDLFQPPAPHVYC